MCSLLWKSYSCSYTDEKCSDNDMIIGWISEWTLRMKSPLIQQLYRTQTETQKKCMFSDIYTYLYIYLYLYITSQSWNYVAAGNKWILLGSLKGPILAWVSTARTEKWYLLPSWNCVKVHAMGSGKAFTSPTCKIHQNALLNMLW